MITTFCVLPHIEPATNHLWSELRRVVKPGGFVFMENPNPRNRRKRLGGVLGRDQNDEIDTWFSAPMFVGHFREHSLRESTYSAHQAGFDIAQSGFMNLILTGKRATAGSLSKKALRELYRAVLLLHPSLQDATYVVATPSS